MAGCQTNDHRRKRILDELKGEKLSVGFIDSYMRQFIGKTSYFIVRPVLKQIWYEQHGYCKQSFSDIEWYFAQNNQAPMRRNNSVRHYLSDEQYRELIDKSRSKKQSLFIQFLGSTGMRVSEACSIKLIDMEYHVGYCQITYIAGKTKLECTRNIRTDFIESIIKEFDGSIYLFETSGKKPYRRSYVSDQIKRQAENVLGFSISAHTLRHYWSTKQHQNNRDPFKVSREMGHKNAGSRFNTYIHGTEKMVDENAMV